MRDPRRAWVMLAFAMLCSATLILWVGRGETFDVDELYYYGRLVDDGSRTVTYAFTPAYVLAPFHSHLQAAGRLAYEGMFATAGANYFLFRVLGTALLLVCVGLFFELARRRVGAALALAPCVVLLFFGFAREVLLWPFDLHTLLALAAGLGALLCLERDDRAGDVAACALVTLSIAAIEVGLAFLAGIAVSVLMRSDRARRAWIFAIPLALYAAWWIWARRFGQPEPVSADVGSVAKTIFDSLAVVLGTLTGTNPLPPGSGFVTETTWFGRALAVLALIGAAVSIRRSGMTRSLWIFLAVLAAFWLLLGLAARPPGGSRYLFAGAILVLLAGAELLRNARSAVVVLAAFALAALALPRNIEALVQGSDEDPLHKDAGSIRTESAMLELARDRVDPAYTPAADPRVVAAGGGLFTALPAGVYLASAERNGSLAASLDEVRDSDEHLREIADATLVDALGVGLRPAAAPASARGCEAIGVTQPAAGSAFRLPPGGALLRPAGDRPVDVGLRRFSSGAGVALGKLPAGRWTAVRIPRDAAPERWFALTDGPVRACPLS